MVRSMILFVAIASLLGQAMALKMDGRPDERCCCTGCSSQKPECHRLTPRTTPPLKQSLRGVGWVCPSTPVKYRRFDRCGIAEVPNVCKEIELSGIKGGYRGNTPPVSEGTPGGSNEAQGELTRDDLGFDPGQSLSAEELETKEEEKVEEKG